MQLCIYQRTFLTILRVFKICPCGYTSARFWPLLRVWRFVHVDIYQRTFLTILRLIFRYIFLKRWQHMCMTIVEADLQRYTFTVHDNWGWVSQIWSLQPGTLARHSKPITSHPAAHLEEFYKLTKCLTEDNFTFIFSMVVEVWRTATPNCSPVDSS